MDGQEIVDPEASQTLIFADAMTEAARKTENTEIPGTHPLAPVMPLNRNDTVLSREFAKA
jgi:hypothetical protein